MFTLVDLAKSFAIRYHGDQKRKYTGEPYWHHLEHVASIVSEYTDDQQMIAAAWLHDVIEDTECTVDRVMDTFGVAVSQLVSGLTDVSTADDGNRATRKALDRIALSAQCRRVHTIKCADLISNTESIVRYDKKFAKVHLGEKRLLLSVLTQAHPDILKRAQQCLEANELLIDA